jgi:hypothetical protein
MTMHHFIRAGCAAALLAAGFGAQAGVVKFEGWAHGNGNSVSVTSPGYSGQAGGFSVTLSGFSGSNALNGAFEAYCVDLYEYISLGSSYTNYSIVAASTMYSASKLAALTQLITYVNNSSVFASAAAGSKDNQSTALQLAIWNIVYDSDKTLDSTPGATFSELTATSTSFRSPSGSSFMGANALLNATASVGGPTYELFVLQSVAPSGRQDQLVWRVSTVPTPGSLALAALALGVAGYASRRRA